MSTQYLPCPDCKTKIPFDPHALVGGERFSCPNCSLSIGLVPDSRETVRNSLKKLEEMKEKIGKKELTAGKRGTIH